MTRHYIYKSSSSAEGAKKALLRLGISAVVKKTPESHQKKGCSRTLKTTDDRVTKSFLSSLGFPPDGEY